MCNAEITVLFQRSGIRPTPQRISVYQFLLSHPIHASADTIYAALQPEYPSFSKTTIYNSIRALEEAGLLRAVKIEGDYVRYDATVEDHGHFKCTQCGKVFDFTAPPVGPAPPELTGFCTDRKDVFYYGTCRQCAKQKDLPLRSNP